MNKIEKLPHLHFRHFCYTLGVVPTSYLDTMTDLEVKLWLIKFLTCEVIPTINENAEALKELQDYFKNLDVQDEINNKLDEMAKNGTLQTIITEYLKLKSELCFDTVENMVNSVNLTDGSYAKTMGFYKINDGGTAQYKIRQKNADEKADNIFTFELVNNTNLLAELIIKNNTLNLLECGCKNNLQEDISEKLYKILYRLKDGGTINIPTGQFLCTHLYIDFQTVNINIIGQGFRSILYNNTTTWTIEFNAKCSNTTFKNFGIWCNGASYGIKFNEITTDKITADYTRITLDTINIRNTRRGIYARNMVYFNCKYLQIGITTSNTDIADNFGMDLSGYEYNSFDTCSFNADDNSTSFPCVILRQTNFLYINNCEFAKTLAGIVMDTSNTKSTCTNIVINSCKFQYTEKAIHLMLNGHSVQSLKIINNTWLSINANSRFLLVNKTNTEHLVGLICNNNSFFKQTNTSSPKAAIEVDSDILQNTSILNNYNSYNVQNYLKLNNNNLAQFSDLSDETIRTETIKADGSTTIFNIYNSADILPILPTAPNFICNIPDINIPYSIASYYHTDTNNITHLRGRITFATPPAEGNYTVYYKVRY